MRFAACTMIASALCACSAFDERDVIEVGTILTTQGINADAYQLEAVKLAFTRVNVAGGVLGKNLSILQREDYGDPSAAAVAAADLSQRVPFIIGPASNGAVAAVLEVTRTAGVGLVSGSVTDPIVTSLRDDGLFFRTVPSEALQGRLLAQRAHAAGKQRVAVFLDTVSTSQIVFAAFRDAFVALGGSVVSTGYVGLASSQRTVEDLCEQALSKDPDALLMVAESKTGGLLLRTYAAEYAAAQPLLVLMTSSMATPSVVAKLDGVELAFPHEGTAPAIADDAVYRSFADDFQDAVGRDPRTGHFADAYFDAACLVALAMEAAGSTDASAIAAELPRIASLGGAVYDHRSLAEALSALRAGEDIDWRGASGNVDLSDAGELSDPSFAIWHIEHGELVFAESAVPVD